LLTYTNLYIRFGFGRDFDSSHAGWQEYLDGLRDATDRSAWTHRFYTRASPAAPPGLVATYGCFSYAQLGPDRIRLHFHDGDGDGGSPLSAARRDRRVAELTALFADVKRRRPDPVHVVGASWLYNIEAYRRLFPAAYLSTAHPIAGRFRHMPLWGQFVNRYGDVRVDTAREFRERLKRQAAVEGLDRCFPYQVLSLEAPASDFYEVYGV